MPRKAAAVKIELPPASHLIALHDAGFTVHSYLNRAILVTVEAGPTLEESRTRSEWLPRLCIGHNERGKGFRVIEWLPQGHPANNYAFDGWQASQDHTTGGMYQTIGQALAWFAWHEAQHCK